ncbi:hypothetical protein EHI8A_065510 [Entamoeba histolytica HM-1:IMSS-B]|uniref:Chorein N-terminal domain-containing protein n=6 Tax=Entamoeba histolytica TaxID=5759 RepID=C4LXW4_ENTH1|nr:hypothetical protein EHI_087840 [Entamoeba histolytica HM-1:IMSS]EMD48814.1 Hypothetical protein EHI5A_101180 [Entamoeba histolytica KU27]EMH75897.1 hypothetical protein EHI8A_065510 [Entamoeba histolytica HM-1:IMSS-B]EMS12010.1 hypothetical protein KM1_122990 [Entamoeba histolytica HM-3:IMSS]ENY63250.1 hypothetical protein EHI7A_062490 [Entamoeba histolytica HM-1:IMSS-A]GAT93615.1 hypothetical protein CL6EHI_087840 [Entamoeba histolytica]|eukprot:XP_655950.1 hypothetical protein EHI_087840 [Entamoeba histolytica HM-1:IMSS]
MDLVASKILKKFLKTFIESCSDWGTGNDVDITPSQGIVTLHDIGFIKDVFREMVLLPSQIEVTTATCSSIDVIVPWTHLYSKPIILRLGEVIVDAHDIVLTPELIRKEQVKNKKEKPKKPKKKKSRELLDTILVEISNFKLSLKIGPSILNLVIQGGETYFADQQFNKINKIENEIPIDNIIYSYRFLQVNSLSLTLTTGNRVVTLCHGMEVIGKYTTQREAESYKLLDTSCIIELTKISLNLSMDDYINLINYFRTFFSIATESAILDVVNADVDETLTHNNSLNPSTNNSTCTSRSSTPPLNVNRIDNELTSSTPSTLSIQKTTTKPMPIAPPKPKSKIPSSSLGSSLSMSPVTSSYSFKKGSSMLSVECVDGGDIKAMKKLEKMEKKQEKKLQKIEKKGEPRTMFKFILEFLKLSLQNEDTDEGIYWIIGDISMTFVPAFGGRIKKGLYGFSIGTIEGMYNSHGNMKRLVWALPEREDDVVLSNELTTTWERNVLINTKMKGELNFVGITMEFEMLKNLIEFLKVTVIDKLSELDVSMLSMKERIEQTLEDAKNKWNQALDILGLGCALDLLKRIDIDFKLNGCRFEGPFPNNEGTFIMELDNVKITNQPSWNELTVDKDISKKLKHQLDIKVIKTPKEINLGIVMGTFAIHLNDKEKTSYLFPPTRADFKMQVKFDESDSVPALIMSQLYFKQIHFDLHHKSFRNIYEYVQQIKEYVQSKMGGEISTFGNKITSTVKESADDITTSAINFVDQSFIPAFRSTEIPAIGLEIVLDDGVVCVPVTSIVQSKEKGGEEGYYSKMKVKGLQLCFGLDKQFRSIGIFLESVITEQLETILSPFNGISPKLNSEWISTEEDPSVSFIWKYDKTQPKTERIMSVELTLFNVQVLLNNLFGVKLEQVIQQKELELTNKIQGKSPRIPSTPRKEVEKKEPTEKTKKLIEWVESKYKGMAVTVNVSECELIAEDHLHKATVSSASPYAKQAECIVNNLMQELNEIKTINEILEQTKQDILDQINELENKKTLCQAELSRKRCRSMSKK